MQRNVFALISGSLFGAGLLISGMTDTLRVQGWLDVFGHWDPTLGFVLAGAILPMALAWRVVTRRQRSYLGLNLPKPAGREIGADLVLGSLLFGAGWALAGLCPGPAMASLGFGGFGGVIFLLAMLGGMLIAPPLRKYLASAVPAIRPRSKMDIRALTPTYAVSPQIDLADLPAIKAAGFSTVIDNRPDGEIPAHLHTPHMQAAAEAIGLKFIANPVIGGAMTMENIRLQAQVMAEASGPVFAYCASGNRCSVVWAMMNAGNQSTDDLIRTPAKFGYNLEPLRGQIDALAAESGPRKG
jgi:uncharacterized protein (TIGR01244 family)